MTNLEHDITMKLIYELSHYFKIFPDGGSLFINNESWYDCYDGMGCYRNCFDNLDFCYKRTLQIARRIFPDYIFYLENTKISNKVLLRYIKK